ncbi:flagellar hook-associated protein FlgK [Chitinilyticum piscinae]|uniref:Flagellar hook-associated protein 1 n=1 Tax=Chitinilyticum piscinae TaxID=2866724 RepID=A0A8J7G3K5_9NEIS|nr:flagellar hook-associated protein FlgK [Chitinilyticum piscinae]MBE9610763.1 flagellar hook-associated protein FlgK [Chitinilyticum piscinae]
MGSSVFGIGVSGLNAANLGLTTTGHNIANVNTKGYSRQTILQSAPYPMGTGSGFVGMGVRVDTISRVYDQFLTRNVQSSQAQSSYYDSYLSHLKEIDNIVADPDAGVSPALQDFFSSVQNVSTNPSNMPSRQQMLASAQTLVNRFQVFEQRLDEQRNSLNGEITNTVNSISALAKNIAEVNNQIALTKGAGQPPNDLLDKRDQLVLELNQYVKASTYPNDDGTINVFVGSGQSLVLGGNAVQLSTAPSPGSPERISVVYDDGVNQVALPDTLLTGGKLGGLLDYRAKSLDLAQNSLNRMALVMAQSFNDQHRVGMDLNGNMGGNFWSYPTLDVSAAVPPFVNTPATPGPATAIAVDPPALGAIYSNANNNPATTTVASGYIADVSKLTTSNYELLYDGTNYVLTRLSDNTRETLNAADIVSADGASTADGLVIRLTPAPNAGDRFTIEPTSGMVSSLAVGMTDPRMIAAAGAVRAAAPQPPATGNTGTLKIFQPQTDLRTNSTTDAPYNPNLRNSVTITFNAGGTFDVVDTTTSTTLATGVPYTAGMTLRYNGWSMKLDGQPAAGDIVNVSANPPTATADNRNALALAGLQTTKILSGNTATYQEAYGQMVSTIGTQTNEAEIMAKAQGTVLNEAVKARDSVSGVNLDEEAANLLRYQQAYQASSKVIQIAQQAFQEILNIGR